MATIHTESGMIQGARIQYRNYFRTMATGGEWCIYRAEPGATLSGVILCTRAEVPDGAVILVHNVQARSENQMAILLSDAIRYGAHPMPTEKHDCGYLQHGTQPGPFRTERVAVRHTMPDIWHARFEGRWRLVHVGVKRCYIVFQGQKITIQIEGV